MTNATSQIAFDQSGLGSVLKHYRLSVPPNQRDYAWTDREVEQLLQDFSHAIAIDEPAYFLGTIVTIPRQHNNLEVIDGQQRLATTAILLAAIRDYLSRHDEMIAESINNDFLSGIDRVRRTRIPNLSLNTDDNDLFRTIISTEQSPDHTHTTKESHQRLLDAYFRAKDHVRDTVADLNQRDHGDHLNRWISFIEHRALVVLLRVPDDSNAYKMFETLNDRGLHTTQADLIKNYLFGRAGDRIQEVQDRWSYMRGTLASLEEDDITADFLRHALIAMRGYTRQADVYDVVQDIVKGDQSAVSFGSALELLANEYVAIFNPSHEKWNEYPESSRRAIQVFNLLNIRPMRALLLAIAAKYAPIEVAKAFQFLVSLGVRLLVSRSTRSSSVELPLAAAANAAYRGEVTTLDGLKHRLRDVIPGDVEFRSDFETARVSKGQLARYYLRSLEMAANQEPAPWFIPTQDALLVNLEHILPKKPLDNWPQFSADEAALYTNRLGNQVLMLASDNSGFGSAAFSEKRQLYASSPYVLTSQVADFVDWCVDSILERQKKLAGIAVSAWPI